MSYCSAQVDSAGFVSTLVRFVDCQAETLGSGGWQALALPGSTLSLMLTSLITLFVAIIGYNLLLGRSLTVRAGVLAMVKIGIVLTLATSWPAYRTLVYDVVVQGPADIVAEIGGPARVAGSDGSLLARLDMADRALAELAILGPGNPPMVAATIQGQPGTQIIVPPPFGGFNAFAIGGARIVFLTAAVGILALVRIVAGLMLALGPFFVAFLLFDSTRSLFEGWIRVLAGAAMGAIGAAIALGVQLTLLEPWLANILARRHAGEALPSVPTELLVVVSMFAIVLVTVIFASARVVRAFRLAPIFNSFETPAASASQQTATAGADTRSSSRTVEERTRADNVVDVLVAAQQREAGSRAAYAASYDPQRIQIAAAGGRTSNSLGNQPITSVGRSFRRRVRGRSSASAGRRDRTG